MINETIKNLQSFFQAQLSQFEEIANSLPPDDPLIVIEHKDISVESYQKMIDNKIIFSDLSTNNQLRYTTWIPWAFIDDLDKTKAFPVSTEGYYQAEMISFMGGHGLVIGGNDRWIAIKPKYWDLTQEIIPSKLWLKGKDAFHFWELYHQLGHSYEAGQLKLAIERNPLLLAHIPYEAPHLSDHPIILNELATAWKERRLPQPKFKQGQKSHITKNIFELYHWVYWYRFQGMSLEKSCMEAVDEHTSLVPDNWTDAYETLKKQVIRLDKYPRVSQKKT